MAVGERFKQESLLYSETFTQLNRDCHWLFLGHLALTKIKCMDCPPRQKLVTVVERWPLLGGGLTVINVNDEFFGAAFVSLEIKVLVIYRHKSELLV